MGGHTAFTVDFLFVASFFGNPATKFLIWHTAVNIIVVVSLLPVYSRSGRYRGPFVYAQSGLNMSCVPRY